MRAWTSVLWVLLAGCTVVRGSGDSAEEERSVPAFLALDANNGTVVILDVDPTTEGDVLLTVSADDNLLPLLTTTVTGDTLFVDVEAHVRATQDLRVEATVASLQAVAANNGSGVDVEGLRGEDLVVDVNNGAAMTLGGDAPQMTLDVNNGASFNGGGLTVGDATVEIANGASATLCATGNVDGSVRSGASLVVLCGGEATAVEASGGGSVTTR